MEPYIEFMGTLQNNGFWLVKELLSRMGLQVGCQVGTLRLWNPHGSGSKRV